MEGEFSVCSLREEDGCGRIQILKTYGMFSKFSMISTSVCIIMLIKAWIFGIQPFLKFFSGGALIFLVFFTVFGCIVSGSLKSACNFAFILDLSSIFLRYSRNGL